MWIDPLGLNPFRLFARLSQRFIKNNKKDKNPDLREQEYQLAKRFCDTPVPPQQSKCATLHLQIQHTERCIDLYQKWDAKWQPGRHASKLQSWENRLNTLKELAKKECM